MPAVMREEDLRLEHRLQEARKRVRANFPNKFSPLTWKKDSAHRIVSACGLFLVDRHGEGPAERFTAILRPWTVLGHDCRTAGEAKELCARHALPEGPPKSPFEEVKTPETPVTPCEVAAPCADCGKPRAECACEGE